ncbi:MAG: hypothetical protein OXG47_00130 [bacterium]|nr:hypothetical protein [bacterium]
MTAPEPVGRYTLGFDGFGQVHFGEDRPGAWRFSVYGYDTTRVAVNRRFTPRPQPPRAASEGQPPNPDSTSTTCTTTPTTPCQAN